MTEPFAELAGVELLEVAPGYARTAMTVDGRHLNMHGTAHGGAVFTLADAAFAAASNAGDHVAVALTMSVAYLSPAQEGERLLCEAREVHATRRTALYEIRVSAVEDERGAPARDVARLQAMVYRKGTKDQNRPAGAPPV
ncbi:MAG: hotdog fold thioesterase [Clostridia bacterium]|nr:hotdog fold thioesterase [Clostridia bacterium]